MAVGGPFSSKVVTAALIKRSLSLAEAAGTTDLTFTTGETAPWLPIVDSSAARGFAAQSGTIGMDETSWMETIVSGKGTLAFKWRVECEEDDSGDHAVRWVFLKDDYDEEEGAFADHGWVSGITWTPVDPLPPLDVAAKDSDAQAIIAGLSDIRLSDTISNATAYVAFRSWVDGKGLSHALVKNAPNAWRSYVLDAPGLMTKAALTSEDVMIESVEPSGTAAGAFDLVVDIGGAEIGSAARLAVALGVEGAAELDISAFTSEGLTVTLERTTHGKAKATVTPAGAPPCFFLRVKVR